MSTQSQRCRKPKEEIENGLPRDIGCIEHTRNMMKTNKTQNRK